MIQSAMDRIGYVIRKEEVQDIEGISRVTQLAFESMAMSDGKEHVIVERLRRSGNLALSLVAEYENNIVGHVAFSPITISDGSEDWYGLGPVSVEPEYQGQGVGSRLVENGLLELQKLNAQGCCVLGEPKFYTRFGFRSYPIIKLEGVPQEYFLAKLMGKVISPNGLVSYHESFNPED